MTNPKYPDSFPTPTVAGYGIDVDMGLTRTEMEKGIAKQRRRYTNMPHKYTCNFVMDYSVLVSWQSWINEFGYDWFDIELSSMYSSLQDPNCLLHSARVISNLSITPLSARAWKVSAILETVQVPADAPTVIGSWISGSRDDGIYPNAASDWIAIVGDDGLGTGIGDYTIDPIDMPTDDIDAGTADNPSALHI